jgi:hypothetical protein
MSYIGRWFVSGAVYALECVVCAQGRVLWPPLLAITVVVSIFVAQVAVLPATATALKLRQLRPGSSRVTAWTAAFGVMCLISLPVALLGMLLFADIADKGFRGVSANLLAWAVVTGLGVLPLGSHLAMTEFVRSGRALPPLGLGAAPFLIGWLVTTCELLLYAFVPHAPWGWRGSLPAELGWPRIALVGLIVGLGATALGSTPARKLAIWLLRRLGAMSWRSASTTALGIACGQSAVVTVVCLLANDPRDPFRTGVTAFTVFFGLAILPVTIQTLWAARAVGRIAGSSGARLGAAC